MKKITITIFICTCFLISLPCQDIKYTRFTYCLQEINKVTSEKDIYFLTFNGKKAFQLGNDIYEYESKTKLTRYLGELIQITTHYVNGSDYSRYFVEMIVTKQDGYLRLSFYRLERNYEYIIDNSGDITKRKGGVIRIFTGKEMHLIVSYIIPEYLF